MPNRTELRGMTKPQLVDFGCSFFTDEGNLRQELEDTNKKDLLELLFESGADVEEEPEEVELEVKASRPSNLDLGNW